MATTDLIDVGSSPNDGTGDPLRTAFQSLNARLRDGDATTPSELRLPEATGNGTDYVAIKPAAALTSNREVLCPDADVDLGEVATNTTHTTGDGSDHADVAAATALLRQPTIVLTGPTHGDTIAVEFKAIDAAGADVAALVPFRWWLSSDNTTGALSGTTPDGGVSATLGTKVDDTTANLAGHGVTDSNGDARLSVNHAGGAVNYYLWAEIGPFVAVSAVIAIT